jgi:hypothetical protein
VPRRDRNPLDPGPPRRRLPRPLPAPLVLTAALLLLAAQESLLHPGSDVGLWSDWCPPVLEIVQDRAGDLRVAPEHTAEQGSHHLCPFDLAASS